MAYIETPLKGCFEITPTLFKDARGSFFEAFNKVHFLAATGISFEVAQENQSTSVKGTIRALHYQKGDYAQAKLVRVLEGDIIDVVVDLRPGSPTYGMHHRIQLSALNLKQLYIPKGFAHGFSVLSKIATVVYACDAPYQKDHEGGVYYADPSLNIDWGLGDSTPLLSEKDQALPLLKDIL